MERRNSGLMNGIIVLVLLLTLIEGAVLVVCRQSIRGLQGMYYDEMEWQGDPLITAVETDISTTTLKAHQGTFPSGRFSAEWTGYIHIPDTGIYTFATNSDDGSWLWIDNILVVDNGGLHGPVEQQGKIYLTKGLHHLKIRYFDGGAYAVLQVFWQTEQTPKAPLTAKVLLPPETSTTRFWLYQKASVMLPFVMIFWAVLIMAVGIFSFEALPVSGEYPSGWSSRLRAAGLFTVRRLVLQPLVFARQQLRKPQVGWWLAVQLYTLVIFLTLSYARTLSDIITQRYSNDIFSQITTAILVIIGIGLLSYLIVTLRTRVIPRLLVLGGIVALYAYILSTSFRAGLETWLPFMAFLEQGLESLDIGKLAPIEQVHFVEYGLLGILLCKALSYHIKDKLAYLAAVAIVYLVGVLDEGIQWILPERVGDYRDIWLNVISGGLAVLMVVTVIRPRVFHKHFRWSSMRPVVYTLAVAVLLTGLFLQFVHGFTSWIFMPDTGTKFVSAFSEEELLRLDAIRLKQLQGEENEGISWLDAKMFEYEAGRHKYYGDSYYGRKWLFESFCEEEILKTYFRSSIQTIPVQLHTYNPAEFTNSPSPGRHVFYVSRAQGLPLERFTGRTMWIVVAISAAMLCLIATWIPRRSLVERLVLRPLFVCLAVGAVVSALYPIFAPPKKIDHTNLLIFTLESSQPDYLSAYGYHHNTTPFFDALADEGVLFSNMVTSSSWTIPSLTSMLTGLSPNIHGIDGRGKLMDQRIPTLFEALEQHGYVIGDTSYTLTEPSINSVFKKPDISPEVALSEGRSEESYLLSWMEANREKPFFGWVHFHTTHLPYRASPPYNKLFLNNIPAEVLNDEPIKCLLSQVIVRKGEVEFDPERHTDAVRALFAQTLRQQDAKLGKVLMKLDELGLRENTLIVVTADHGDELLEHGFVGHASTNWDSTVYDDLVHIPLVIYYPKKLPKGKKIETQVRMIDIMPTVLDILDVAFSEQIQGKSFLPLIQGQADFQEVAFSETTPCGYSCPKRLANDRLRSVRTNEWKLISTYRDDTKETMYELYDLKHDPAETTDVIEQYPQKAEQLKQELLAWLEAPAQFAYQTEESEEEHYLDVDVEVRPIVVFPKVGTVVSPDTHNKRILIKWIGDENMDYLIEYEVGTGGYHITGELEVVGPEQWFGPFPEDIWQALPLYNPWKFRIVPKKYPQFPSEWITFEMSS